VILVYGRLIAEILMILSVLEGHSPIASLFKNDISYLWHVVWSAELLVIIRMFEYFTAFCAFGLKMPIDALKWFSE